MPWCYSRVAGHASVWLATLEFNGEILWSDRTISPCSLVVDKQIVIVRIHSGICMYKKCSCTVCPCDSARTDVYIHGFMLYKYVKLVTCGHVYGMD